MREIVHLQAGQCGNQIGSKVSEIFSNIFSNIASEKSFHIHDNRAYKSRTCNSEILHRLYMYMYISCIIYGCFLFDRFKAAIKVIFDIYT